jgi:hypothetical protein
VRARSGRPFFDHLKDPAALRWTDLEKGHPVTRTLVVRALDAETAGFPFVAQGARLRRERVGQTPETVELITSRAPAALPLAQWLEANITHWGIETGLHARLDASRHDDRCRLRERNGVHLHGAFTRWANSLFVHWREQQPNGRHLTTTDHQTHFGEDHARRAILAVTAKRFPS